MHEDNDLKKGTFDIFKGSFDRDITLLSVAAAVLTGFKDGLAKRDFDQNLIGEAMIVANIVLEEEDIHSEWESYGY